MVFGKPKPTVTPEDKDWIEEAFLWFEEEYTRDYLKSVRFIEPTEEFFPIDFKGTQQNAEDLTQLICGYMGIKEVQIDLHYPIDKSLEPAKGNVSGQNEAVFKQLSKNIAGTYPENGPKKYSVVIESSLLKEPANLVAKIAYELSHLVLPEEGKLTGNDAELTGLNCVALGFGIFICNSIFSFDQWQGDNRQGWQTQKNASISEEVATYGLALMTKYQNRESNSWVGYLNPSPKKMFNTNIRYLSTTTDEIRFR